MSALKDKAVESARRIEAARACEPVEDWHVQFLRALGGGNSGTARVYGAEKAPPPTSTERLLAAVQRAAAADAISRARKPADTLSPEQRRVAADAYRLTAAQIERG